MPTPSDDIASSTPGELPSASSVISQRDPPDDPEHLTVAEARQSPRHAESSSPSPRATEQRQPTGDASALWSRAYEALREENKQLMKQYEILLSQELREQEPSASGTQRIPQRSDGENQHDNRLDTDPNKRRAQLKTITDCGLQRADDKRTKYSIFGLQFILRDQVQQTTQFMLAIKGLVDEAVKASPEASLAWAGLCVLLPVFTNPIAAEEANRGGLSYVTSRLGYYVELECLLWPEPLAKTGLKAKFDDHVVELYQRILEFQVKTVIRFYRKWVKKLVSDIIQHDEWEGMLSKIKEQEQVVRDESNHLQLVASGRTLQDISEAAQQFYKVMQSLLGEQRRTNQTLQSQPLNLPVVDEARYDSGDGPRCETGTRVRIQEMIYKWADDDSGEPIFWLVGPAGTGKSTIARTITDSWAKQKRLVAGYFFKRGEKGRNDTTRLFPTLAAQLSEEIHAFRDCLRESLSGLNKDAVESKGLEYQFNQLLWCPLADLSLDTSGPTKVIIIDALDECERPGHLGQVLNLLTKLGTVNTVRLRVLVTSRSTPHIADAFRGICPRSLDLETEHQVETRTDVATFLKHRFASIKARWEIQENWPDERQLNRLIQLSTTPSPLFIYAATLCRFIDDPDKREDPVDQLDLWFHQSDSGTPQLDQIYRPILHYILFGSYNTNEKPKPLAARRQTELFHLLGAVVLLASPLPSKAIAALLGIPIRRITPWLYHLRAVLSVPRDHDTPVTLLHKSFSDFLLSSEGSSHRDYGVYVAPTHATLAAKCIQRMKEGLRRDICDTQKPDLQRDEIDKEVLNTHIPADLRYACLYWVYHLQQSGGSLGNDVYVFLTMHFLHWLEVLALLGKVSDGASAMKQLLKMCQN
ncbi:vegetative incompatibility protein het-e-1 [Colletotrichum kahawae]|uniref:Vegetative incompatibility protein het-e-1 n=1 Tax=Colletotrichum kahawae TaxID=34407 RepID=A0AAE0D3P4_COLKA|nr:vegetative incompatibility protein het-e-1 [Colletotrichum kahawae]